MSTGTINLILNTGQAENALNRFSGRFNNFVNNMQRSAASATALSSAMSRLRNIFVGFAGVSVLRAEMEKIDSMRKSADALGISFERLQKYMRAGLVGGVSNVEGILTRAEDFLEKLRRGEESAKRIGRALGIGVASSIEDLIRKVGESPNRISYQREIFGRGVGARDIRALLEDIKGSDISEDFAKAIERFNDSVALFKETIVRDFLGVLEPLIRGGSEILSNKLTKYGVYALGASILFGAFNKLLYSGRPTALTAKSTPAVYGFSKAGLRMKDVGVVTAAQVQRTFHMPLFAAHGKRVAVSAEMLGGLLAYSVVRKVFAAMASKSFSSNLLPAVSYMAKHIAGVASMFLSVGKILARFTPYIAAGFGLYGVYKGIKSLYDYNMFYARDLVGSIGGFIKSIFIQMKNAFSRIKQYVVDFYNNSGVWFKSFVQSFGDLFGFNIPDVIGEKSIALSNRKKIVDAQISDMLSSVDRRIEEIGNFITSISEVLPRKKAEYDLSQPGKMLSDVQSRIDEINKAIIDVDFYLSQTDDDVVRERLNNLRDTYTQLLNSLSDVYKRINESQKEVVASVVKSISGRDIDDFKTMSDVYREYFEKFSKLAGLYESGDISFEKYAMIYEQMMEDYSKAVAATPEGRRIEEIKNSFSKWFESIKSESDRLTEVSREIVEEINPFERFKGRIADAVKAFQWGIIDFSTLFTFARKTYEDIFSMNRGVTSPLVGQAGITSYFTGVYNSIVTPVWNIQMLLQQIASQGVYLRG